MWCAVCLEGAVKAREEVVFPSGQRSVRGRKRSEFEVRENGSCLFFFHFLLISPEELEAALLGPLRDEESKAHSFNEMSQTIGEHLEYLPL